MKEGPTPVAHRVSPPTASAATSMSCPPRTGHCR